LTGVFGDLVFLIVTVVFFALAVLLIRACEHISGPEPTAVQLENPGEVRP
jgi:hypothetical protein